jgi:glycerate 2-kinase
MVNVLVAPDKFKGSLTAPEVCDAVKAFLLKGKKHSVSLLPLADGGEGTFEILLDYFHGTTHHISVHDPLMRKINATYGLSQDKKTAFIEMAKASGLQLLKNNERNPLITSTYGTGELIADALLRKAEKIILGIGGSATNDAGVGMAKALGFRFLDKSGTEVHGSGGKILNEIAAIDDSQVNPLLRHVSVIALCDVKNPLTGTEGAAKVFAPQKGASPFDTEILEQSMVSFQVLLRSKFRFDTMFEGAGAAGGLGAGASFFLKAQLRPGMDFIAEATNLEKKIADCDVVITGEGKLDSQSLSGKVVQRVITLAKKYRKRTIILCGVLDLPPAQVQDLGVDEFIVLSEDGEIQNSMSNASELIKTRLHSSKILKSL